MEVLVVCSDNYPDKYLHYKAVDCNGEVVIATFIPASLSLTIGIRFESNRNVGMY